MLNLHLKIVDYHAYSTSVIIPLTHNFDELMDNEYDILKKGVFFLIRKNTSRMVQSGPVKICSSAKVMRTPAKNFKSNFFRILEINQDFLHLGEMAKYQ